MGAIHIKKLKKSYDNFILDIEELEIKEGYITGFIGPNGAGKTTTIKCILDMVKTDKGEVRVLGYNIKQNPYIKEDIAYIGGVSGFLEEGKLKNIKKGIQIFYSNWDEQVYKTYISTFNLNENKCYQDLSKGQQKQFELSIAFAHHPKLFIMDEPTANLDPIIRNEFIEMIQEIMEKENVSVFYSTHITSDLDKCADYIVLIDEGKILLKGEKDEILEEHVLVKGKKELFDKEIKEEFIGIKNNSFGFEGMIYGRKKAFELFGKEVVYERCSLEDILLYYTKGEENNERIK